MKKIILNLLIGMFSLSAIAQSEEILNNETVLKLNKLNFSSSVIVNKIQTSKTSFDVSTDALIKLKESKVSDEVIAAMMTAKSNQGNSGSDYGSSDYSNPLAMHKPGLYYYKSEGSKGNLVELEPSTISQAKSKGFFGSAMTYGLAKVKVVTSIAGSSSNLRINDSKPIFYAYFDKSKSNMDENAGPTNPHDFVLVKLDVTKNQREVVVGSANGLGSSSGIEDKNKIPFISEKVADGIYKITFDQSIRSGEYGFFFAGKAVAGSAVSQKAFDFNIQ